MMAIFEANYSRVVAEMQEMVDVYSVSLEPLENAVFVAPLAASW